MLELMPPFYFLNFAKSWYQSRKPLVSKKVSVSVSKTFGLEKSLGIGLKNIWSQKKVSVSKILVMNKSLGIGLGGIFWSRHSVDTTRII